MSAVQRRARPALGTLVEMRVEGLGEAQALRAIDAAFVEVFTVHRLMSFHETGSDLGRIHAAMPGSAVAVDERTFEVLRIAQEIAALTQGVFDVSIAAQLVRAGRLPRPHSPFEVDPAANWRDIELLHDQRVVLHRPLWLDLGGIAKGYAVDRAIEVLRAHGASQACVNAGGDLRVSGTRAEPVFLRVGRSAAPQVPALELADGAVATSACDFDGDTDGSHFHGVTRAALRRGTSVSVIAARCVIADALTKVALAGDAAITRKALTAFAAEACMQDPAHGWQRLGRAA